MQTLSYPKIAILLAAHNGMQYLEEQIQSILLQEKVEVTLFIGLDYSTDDSESWLQKISKEEKSIVFLPYGEIFGSAARNFFHLIRTIDFSGYDYVAFSDQDDIWYRDKLANAVFKLRSFSYDAYSSNVTAFWENGKKCLVNKAYPQRRWDFLFEGAGPGCTYVLKADLMTAIKRHIIEVWELVQRIAFHDWFCYAYARSNHYKWYIDPIPSMLYRQHSQNEFGVNKGLRAYMMRLKKLINGVWIAQSMLIANVLHISYPFLKKDSLMPSKIKYMKMFVCAFHCRRKRLDQLFFSVMCLYFFLENLYNQSYGNGNLPEK